jgi:hypothetical protein
MGKYRLIVFTEPVAGREAEFNDWYNNQHLSDVVAVPGFVAGQRFRLVQPCGGEFKQRYLAIYEIESEDYAGAVQEMMSRAGTPAMVVSEALDSDNVALAVFEECSARVAPPARSG